MTEKQNDSMVVSSYSCLSKLSPSIKRIHFRKFVSKKLIKQVLSTCSDLQEISFPQHMSEKLNPDIVNILLQKNIVIMISEKTPGRPSVLDNIMYKKTGWKYIGKEYYKYRKLKIAA